jgi:hypothetical protein
VTELNSFPSGVNASRFVVRPTGMCHCVVSACVTNRSQVWVVSDRTSYRRLQKITQKQLSLSLLFPCYFASSHSRFFRQCFCIFRGCVFCSVLFFLNAQENNNGQSQFLISGLIWSGLYLARPLACVVTVRRASY